MVIRRRRRAIPADLQHQAPAGAVRIQETWPDVRWLDVDGQAL